MDHKRKGAVKDYYKDLWPQQLEGWYYHLMRWEDWEGGLWSRGSGVQFGAC